MMVGDFIDLCQSGFGMGTTATISGDFKQLVNVPSTEPWDVIVDVCGKPTKIAEIRKMDDCPEAVFREFMCQVLKAEAEYEG